MTYNINSVLTEDEYYFLTSQDIDPDDVFNGRYMKKAAAQNEMRNLGKTILLGTRCRKAGHRLRTRSGHCIQCDTSKIAYSNRYHKEGMVYLAHSKDLDIVKVGSTIDLEKRSYTLRAHGYGGAGDWEVILAYPTREMGVVERNIQTKLSKFRIVNQYRKEGKMQDAGEIFKLPLHVAKNVFERIAQSK